MGKLVVAHLDITSWVGISIGAVHSYCQVIVEEGENPKETHRFKMERVMDAKEVSTLNKEFKERGLLGDRWSPGDKTEGFITEADAIRAGTEFFAKNYKGILYDGGYASCSAWKKVILCQPQFGELVNKMNAIADKFQKLNGYECEKKHKQIVERLDARWYKKMRKLEELCHKA